MKKQLLMTPGPTPVPRGIMDTMAEPMVHHRTPEFRAIVKRAADGLKTTFKTSNDCLIFASSGTGAMEASVANLLSPGDKAIAIRGGKFGERYYDICKAFGVDVIPLDVEWGASPSAESVREILNKNRDVKAVYTELCETSTATLFDIKSIGKVTGEFGAALVVDAISGLGADNLETDAWGVDVAVGGSQKALMLPPGLSFCTVSQKAWGMIKESKIVKYYFDFNKYKKSIDKDDTPFTPAITLIKGLDNSLEAVRPGGIDPIIRKCSDMAEAMRNGAKELGLEVYSKSPSNAVTALRMPPGVDASSLIKAMKSAGIIVAGGQADLKGKIIRVAHMGGITMADVDRTINALRDALKQI